MSRQSPERHDRRAALIAASIGGGLSASEAAELDELRRSDPSVDAEIDELADTARRVSALAAWESGPPPPSLRDRILAETGQGARASVGGDPDLPSAPGTVTPIGPRRRRTAAVLIGTAAACLALGAGGTLLVQSALDAPVDGPPGTLGALEQVTFAGQPAEVEIDGDIVAHTWGTETILEIEGLPVGETFSVVLLETGGEEQSAGAFLGSAVTVTCRMNAAVLRDEVVGVEIRDDDGVVVAAASMPEVAS